MLLFRLINLYGTGKTIYTKVLKPIYLELRKDAYASDEVESVKRKTKKKNVKHQKSERSYKRKANS